MTGWDGGGGGGVQREEGWSLQPPRLWPSLPGVTGPDPLVVCGSGTESLLHHSDSNCTGLLEQIAGTWRHKGSILHLIYLNRLFASQATQREML